MEKRIKLSVLGFSFNQNNTGTYGLVLAEEKGARRLVVMIGTAEAQAIAFKLQNTVPPRPLTHDLLYALLITFDITLIEVMIYTYNDGIFFSKIVLQQDNKLVELEARTSDAINIALRTNAPIYATEHIMNELSVVFQDDSQSKLDSEAQTGADLAGNYKQLDCNEIEKLLEKAVNEENYELASLLRDELKSRDV